MDFGVSRSPVQALHLISQDHARHCPFDWQIDLEWIALSLARNRTTEGESNLPVVRLGRDNQHRPPTCLFMASLGVEADPDDVTSIWCNILCYHNSFPFAGPKSISV